jgi:DNA repair protein RecN (Recombination protein N)
VAAHAETHLVVTRQGASAAVTKVDGEARLQELTRMLSGLPDSDKGKRHAAELLALAGRRG